MREDMAAYDADSAKYAVTGLLARFRGVSKADLYQNTSAPPSVVTSTCLAGWFAALRSDFGPLPDQSMQKKQLLPT